MTARFDRSLALVLGALVVFACAACGEEAPPPPPVVLAPPPEPPPSAPPPSPCERVCDRVMGCDMSELGGRGTCVQRCMARAPRDVEMLDCLAAPTSDGSRRCDLARRCTEVWVERRARPVAIVPEGERLDARALGPDLELTLEARLVSASTDASRYDLVLLIRGRGQWDGGVADHDAGEPLDAGSFDGGLEAPDLWVRLGASSSDGRLPLVRVQPQPPGGEEGMLFTHQAQTTRSSDTYRVRRARDELVVEHAFRERGGSADLVSDFEARLRVELAPGASIRTFRELVP